MLNMNNRVSKELQDRAIKHIVSSGNKTNETKVFYREMLDIVQKEECRLDRYYYEFNYNEILEMLKSWGITTFHSIKTINTILNNYLDFYVDEGKIDSKYAIYIRSSQLMDCISDDNEGMYFTSEAEYEMFVKSFCYNAQDAVIFSLLFEGVRGIAHQEIRNLREDDVDFTNKTLTLRQEDKDGLEHTRTIKMGETLMDTIHDAIHDDIYFKNNGMVSEDIKTETFAIERNGFVVRNTGRFSDEPIGTHVIVQRVRRLADAYGKEKLNPKNIFHSGMILKLKRIEDKNGEITNQDIKDIHTIYNLNESTWHSTKRLYESVRNSFTSSI